MPEASSVRIATVAFRDRREHFTTIEDGRLVLAERGKLSVRVRTPETSTSGDDVAERGRARTT